tara:strand:- start:1234 stop:1551 length:318 start_codon:yes stop_codon:yes gene_type:complete
MDKIRYCFDIDGTICTTNCQYKDAVPYQNVIDWINKKYDEGHNVELFTSRGKSSGIDWSDFTKEQIESWGVKHHKLTLGKPAYDIFIDDRAINNEEWYKKEDLTI